MSLALQSTASNRNWEAEKPSLNDFLAELHACSIRQRFARNAMVFSEGDDAERVYKIIDGVVRVCKHTADGRRHIVDFALAGELFGYVEHERHGFTAEAVSDLIVVSYPRHRLEHLGRVHPDLGRRMMARLYGHLLTMQHQLLMLGCHGAKERLVAFLLRLAERSDVTAGERLDLAMGRQDIADHLGLTVETICRTIRDLKLSGLVTIPNAHQLILNNVAGLAALVRVN